MSTSDLAKNQKAFDPRAGTLDPRVFGDPETYQLELELIFERCWQFLSHESALNMPGQYVATFLGEVPILLWRGLDCELRAFINTCVASSSALALAESGTVRSHVCACHGWHYQSDGHVTELTDVYLPTMARLDTYGGLIFGSLDEEAAPLIEYLGDFAWYLDTFLNRTKEGTEPVGGVMKRMLPVNWKLPIEAFSGDLYREAVSHASLTTFQGRREDSIDYNTRGFQIASGNGTLATLWREDVDTHEDRRAHPGRKRMEAVQRLGNIRGKDLTPILGCLFPNLGIHWQTRTLHICYPRGPSNTEIWSYCLVETGTSAKQRAEIRREASLYFGPAGLAEQEDAEIWSAITENSRRVNTRSALLNFQMGRGRERFHEDLPGIVSPLFSEMNQRAFYGTWSKMLGQSLSQ